MRRIDVSKRVVREREIFGAASDRLFRFVERRADTTIDFCDHLFVRLRVSDNVAGYESLPDETIVFLKFLRVRPPLHLLGAKVSVYDVLSCAAAKRVAGDDSLGAKIIANFIVNAAKVLCVYVRKERLRSSENEILRRARSVDHERKDRMRGAFLVFCDFLFAEDSRKDRVL